MDIFSLSCHFSLFSPSLWETTRYRRQYCLKGPLNPKQPTNQSFAVEKMCASSWSRTQDRQISWTALNHLSYVCVCVCACVCMGALCEVEDQTALEQLLFGKSFTKCSGVACVIPRPLCVNQECYVPKCLTFQGQG